MGLQGNLATIILPDVLQLLSTSLKTGILHVQGKGGITKKVTFRNGRIISTSSSDPREYLGQFLISRGYISEEQLNKAMETQLQTGIMLGRILTTVGVVSDDELRSILQLKAEESLYDIFLWDEGRFEFEELEIVDDGLVSIDLDVTSLIMEGVRRKDEWARIRSIFSSDRIVLSKTEAELDPSVANPHSLVWRAYEIFDGKKSLADAALELHTTEFLVSEAAFRLHDRGLLTLAGEKARPEEKAYAEIQRKLLTEAAKALEEKKYDEALNLYRYLQKTLPGDEEVALGLSRSEECVSQAFFQQVVPLSSVLELAIPLSDLTKLDLTPQEGYLASRANGSWDIGAILKVSPLPERDALRAIRKLLERRVLRVKYR
jgi:hypothetical protein